NVILEYLTERLVDEACGAIEGAHVERFNRHALLKAQAKEYVRQTQARLILQPVVEQLAGRVGRAGVEAQLRRLLANLRERTPRLPGYAGGNALNLLLHLGVDLHGYDFSQLSVWQADLRGVASAAINFSHADLSHSAFTTVFRLTALRFTAAGQLLVAGLNSDELCLWRAADGQLHDLFRRPGAGAHPVVFSQDGQLVANCGLDHSVRVWSTASGDRLHTLQGHTDRLYTLAFSADGQRLASSCCDSTVRVWDLTSDQLLLSLHEHATSITALAFSTDGTMLAGGGDRVIYLWHTASGQVIRTLLGHSREIECLAFTTDDRQLISGAHDGSIRLWDVSSGQSLRTLQGHGQIVRAVALHPDGHTLASGGADRVVRLWNLRDGQTLRTLFGHAYEITELAFSADGQVLASGSADPAVKLWDTCSGNLIDTLRGHGEIVHSIHFSPNGQLLANSSATGMVRLWDIGAQEAVAAARGQPVRSLQGHAPVVRAVVFSPDGRLLASGGTDQVVQVWDVESGTARHTLRGHTNTIKALAFRPDGLMLASGGSDRTIRLWPVSADSTPAGQTGRVLRGHTDEIGSLAFSPDGSTLLSSSLDHTARIWAIDGGQETRVLTAQGCELSGAVFSPDGQLAVTTAYNGTVHAWDVGSGQRLELWSGSDITAELVAFSQDGATLACVRSDQAIEIRHASTGAVLQMLRGHRGAFLSIAFSPTQPILASSGWNGTIRLWNVETGACLHTLHAPGPYAGMNIAGVTGISETQKAALWALGAVEEAPRAATPQIEQPAPRPAPAPQHNLPSPLTSFVGRADELASLAALLAGDTRLVTLIGAGGAGKTRLALAIAWQLLPQFADGIWWVALAGVQPVGDSAHQRGTLASAVATALGRTLAGRRHPLDELADALQDRAALLVLDNCEHLPEAAAVARALIEAAPQVRVVATSREPLGLGGEALVRLEGLPVPLPGASDPASYPGVQLFLERAARHTPDWGQGPGTIAATARLCRLLEGLPLGIELAAHWVGHYTPDDIAEAIQADLDFLAVRTRDLPDRHRSLRAVFDYAWHLLSAAEQRALARLSVFRGSFDGAAAEAVAEVDATTLVALVDKSLLRQAGAEHHSLHELLRQF
ncbi:MAG TPA: hypothetical protein VFO07_00180, partial [Roseiflexaceae bacterium]|nr:hypothetical protein [Roseiflexaceae bacterium]